MLSSLLLVTSTLALAVHSTSAPAPKLTPAIIHSSRADNTLHILGATDYAPLATIDIKLGAHETAISPDGRWLMGSAYGGPGANHQPADNRVAIVDLSTGKLHRTVVLHQAQRPNDIVFLPNSAEAVVTTEAPPHLVVINADSGEQRWIKINVPTGHMLALSPKGDTAYVAHVMPGALSVVDIALGKVTSTIELPTGAEGITLSRDASRLWIACNRENKVCIVNTADKPKIEHTLDCRGFPFRARTSPTGKHVAITCAAAGEVAIFDSADHTKVDRVSVLDPDAKSKLVPTALAFLPGGQKLAVLLEGASAEIAVLDMTTRKVSARVPAKGPLADALTAGNIRRPEPS
jgi:DNA-binding beta-propeller fold protein YncE